jgi:hypothetical protein
MTRRLRLYSATVIALAGWMMPSRMDAQGAPTAAECRAAIDSATVSGRPQALDATLIGCGRPGTAAIAAVVAASARETDPAQFSRLVTINPQSGLIFAAAMGLVGNPGATATARIGGMRLLAGQLLGRGGDVMTSRGAHALGAEGTLCTAMVLDTGDRTPTPADPLPADHARQVRELSQRVARDAAADPAVRRVAQCLRRSFHEPLPRPSVDASTISITNICNRQFRVTNRGGEAVMLTYNVAGHPGRTKIIARVGTSFIAAGHSGTVQLYDGDRLIGSAANRDIPCATTPL